MPIDTLNASDLDAAHALSGQAGWNQNETDWPRLIDCPTARTFAGRIDGEVVATTTTYNEPVCRIGMVLVDVVDDILSEMLAEFGPRSLGG